uniref:tyrosine-type recombinase/integrase n=1 Tax=Agathobacter sp. TaxID=2021311 RepID=UPI004056837C
MPNITTVALTKEQYKEIIETMRTGGAGFRPNERIATALILEANLGIRISDILALTPKNIIKDGNRYRLNITEIKTKKKRPFTVPKEVHTFINEYCKKYNILPSERLFPYTERNIQKYLKKVTDYLGYENIGTHSFRKFFATDILEKNDYNIVLVQQLLQHSSPTTTQRYIGITSEQMEHALNEHIALL